MAYKIVSNIANDQNIADNSTTQNEVLGRIVNAYDISRGWGEFIYLKGLASTAVGEVVHYNSDDYSTTLAVANGIGPIAVAMAATVASEYGWYQISGKASALALTGFADDANVYLTATAGSIDDADVAGDYVANAKGASAVASGLADLEISRPSTADALDN
jgi:hypothetical protein